ncbi:nucleotidyltransferase [Gallibacterium anatis]|uniref:Cyclic GMP-AMP synthase n=2 Tax=Pasteurellaceae TaxID=712 RepID=A0A921L2G5_9PAST|nr:nucleotidyltransferase [Gallibacterium anatis]MDK9431114.1 nucleotidyltransferase [Gallibacterium anatis]WIM80684.1 nucleotidyltransferase [Gallibacterium anatis]HJF75004.1 nucleotidyltransferase [Gallibacterium anatis]
MANIQQYFEKFNETIRTGYKYNEELKEKRNKLLDNLKNNLDLTFSHFNQGSYGMGTGVKPIDGDFDIDVGLVFRENSNEILDCPFQLKSKVGQALKHVRRTVKIKRPCVTVQYVEDGEDKYHVDFAIYKENQFGELFFARGKSLDDEELNWESVDPKELVSLIKEKYPEGQKRKQYKRCIRALKRWKSYKLNHKNLPSIAITVAAYQYFEPKFYDDNEDLPNDVEALITFLDNLAACLIDKYLLLPTKPNSNLLENLTDKQSQELIAKLRKLKDDLESSQDESSSPKDACKKMKKHFGQDFPLPEGTNLSTEEFIEEKFALSKELRPLYLSMEISNYNSLIYSVLSRFDRDLKLIPKGRTLTFKVENAQDFIGCDFYWKVMNIGREAERYGIRGQINKGGVTQIEHSTFPGEHYVECYAIEDGVCIARETIEVPI